MCLSLKSVAFYLPIIRHHHERIDGNGYPDHLRGAEIPIGARIVAVADSWDAMTSDRPYRPGLEIDEALSRLRQGSGTQWDPDAVGMLLQLLDLGTLQRLTNLVSTGA